MLFWTEAKRARHSCLRGTSIWPAESDKHVRSVLIWQACGFYTGFSNYDATNKLVKATDSRLVQLLRGVV